MESERAYQDESVMKQLYVEEKMTIPDMADELNCSTGTISNWLSRHGIDTRWKGPGRTKPYASYLTRSDGVEVWSTEEGNVLVHRLLAVVEYGFSSVADNDVHHVSGIPWDNRPTNIVVESRSDHVQRHWEQGDYDHIKDKNQYTNHE